MHPCFFHAIAAAAALLCFSINASGEEASPAISAADALARLQAGNQRFASSKLEHPHQNAGRRVELATSQHPFAIVLGCSDSRTSPEVVFDQGLGDLFEIRIAGNVLNNETLGSIEYAVMHLGTRLIVVLGHQRCGAIKAARETIEARTEAPGHIQSLVTALAPAVQSTSGQDAEATAKTNVLDVTRALRSSNPILKEMTAKGAVTVVGAYYDLDTGRVEFLPDAKVK